MSSLAVWLGAALLLFASVYLGTGWSLVAFQFPGALASTSAADFDVRFGAPVKRAVRFFGVWSLLMVAGSLWLTIIQWDQGNHRWGPLIYLVMCIVATAFTVLFILPVNNKLAVPIDDETVFDEILGRWILLNIIRAAMWAVEWLAIALWFVAVASKG